MVKSHNSLELKLSRNIMFKANSNDNYHFLNYNCNKRKVRLMYFHLYLNSKINR